MPKYFLDNIDWDLGAYLSEIGRVSGSVSDSIRKITDIIQEDDKKAPEIEIIEDFGSAEINPILLQSLVDLSNDLKSQVFFNSLIISVYSFLEYSLMEYCRLLDLYLKPERRFKDTPDKGIDKCNTYINTNFNFKINQFIHWSEIRFLQRLRNLVAHNNSSLLTEYGMNLKAQPDFKVFDQNKNIRITEAGYFFIKEIKYVRRLMDITIELINYIIDEMKEELNKIEAPNSDDHMSIESF